MSYIEDCFRPSPLAELCGPLNGSALNQLPRPKTSEEEIRLRATLQQGWKVPMYQIIIEQEEAAQRAMKLLEDCNE